MQCILFPYALASAKLRHEETTRVTPGTSLGGVGIRTEALLLLVHLSGFCLGSSALVNLVVTQNLET